MANAEIRHAVWSVLCAVQMFDKVWYIALYLIYIDRSDITSYTFRVIKFRRPTVHNSNKKQIHFLSLHDDSNNKRPSFGCCSLSTLEHRTTVKWTENIQMENLEHTVTIFKENSEEQRWVGKNKYEVLCRFLNWDLTQWSLYVPPVQHSTILRSAHTVYLCVLCGSENKQRLCPYTALTDWFL